MVTQNDNYDIDTVIDQAVTEDTAAAATEEVDDTPSEDTTAPVEAVQETTEATPEPEAPAAEATFAGTPGDIPPSVPQVQPPVATPVDQGRVRQLETQNAQYIEAQRVQRMEQEVLQIKNDLESQGFLPDQANQIANNMKEQAEREAKILQTAQQREDFIKGQHTAAITYAKQYGLSWDDLNSLHTFNTPAEMEREAKRMSETKEMKTKISSYEQGRVPPQQFDTGQSSPAAGRSRERLLDDYINGRISLSPEQYNRLTNGR